MMPGRLFTGARTPRLALLGALLGLSSGCVTPKPDLKTASPNLRLPKPSNVSNTPREVPPKSADTPAPVSVRTPAKEVPPSVSGPGLSLSSGQSANGNLTTDVVVPQKFAANPAVMTPVSANAAYTANPVVGPAPVPRDAGTNSGIVAPAMPPPPASPTPLKIGTPGLPGG